MPTNNSRKLVLVASCAVLLACRAGVATEPAVPQRQSEVEKTVRRELLAAFSALDSPEKRQGVQGILERCLLGPDEHARDAAMEFLWDNLRWLDLRPWSTTLLAADKVLYDSPGRVLLTRNELALASRSVRAEAYAAAIRGERPDTLPVLGSAKDAVLDGIEELRPAIVSLRQTLDGRSRRELDADYVSAALELRRGAENREDAASLAAERIAAMPDSLFQRGMDQDSGFQRAVLEAARFVCEKNPFSGETPSGCAEIADVAWRQYVLAGGSLDTASGRTAAPELCPWLKSITEYSRGPLSELVASMRRTP